MKKWLEKTGIPVFVAIISLNLLYSILHPLLANRRELDMIYRWELSGLVPGLLFFTMACTQFLEARGKERIANMLTIVGGSMMFMLGLVIMFIFDSDFGFIGDMMMLLGVPGIHVVMGVVRLRRAGKEPLLTKRTQNLVSAILIVVTVLIFIATVLLILGIL